MKNLSYSKLVELTNAFSQNENAMHSLFNKLNAKGMLAEIEEELIPEVNKEVFNPRALGKIVILGTTKISKAVMLAIATGFGLDKNRFEFVTDYDGSKGYQIQKMRNSSKYAAVIVAAVPHKTVSTGDYASVVSAMRNTPGYPAVFHDGKVTKASFTAMIQQMLANNTVMA